MNEDNKRSGKSAVIKTSTRQVRPSFPLSRREGLKLTAEACFGVFRRSSCL